MWTPKRITLLAVGFLVFTLVYIVYSMTTLGRINTLPPLPEKFSETGNPREEPTNGTSRTGPSPLERKLEMAFRPGCPELKWPVLLELDSKSMVMAAMDYELQKDGRLMLKSMSLALFGKKKNDGKENEINTLRCKRAYLTFDRPVTSLSPSEFSGRKVIEATLHGEGGTPITIVNNRRTSMPDDDLTVTIHSGPLHYDERKQLIWTNDLVELQDGCPLPKAHIQGKGMTMDLETSAPPPKPGAAVASKPKSESISGVKRIVLKQDVTMHLNVAGQTPFPGGDKDHPRSAEGKDAPPAAAAKPPAEPAHIIIRTPGRFQYDLFKDHDLARFDVPNDADQANSPQDVTVVRVTKKQEGSDKPKESDKPKGRDKQEESVLMDQLVCKHLELRLKRHSDDASPPRGSPPAAQSPEQGLEIETAHATGPDVTLTSDAEKLDAHGNDFFHDAAKKLTKLKGVPYMVANKEDNRIKAPELSIQDIPLPVPAGSPPKTFQQIQAKGPGSIHMINKTTGKEQTRAFWKDKLISTRDGELDLLILTGSARFEEDKDAEPKQSAQAETVKQWLQAETLKVWLLPEDKKADKKPDAEDKKADAEDKKPEKKTAATTNKAADPQQSRRPHQIEALRNVVSHSREINIHDTSRLLVRFTDVPKDRMPPERTPPPSASAAKTGTRPQQAPATSAARLAAPTDPATPRPPAVGTASRAAPVSPAMPPAQATGKAATVPGPTQAAAPDAPPRPIDMTARSIEAEALRCGERVVLDHLWAQGSPIDSKGGVQVRQEPDLKKDERGVYIEGNSLEMKCYPNGNVLDVSGDLAQLLMDKILILGPEVHIDQTSNQASVRGEGAMEMQSNQTLDGKPLTQTVNGKKVPRTVPLTVHWREDMVFSGEHAEFHGDIQATQENARLACQYLQVFFDRPISLKEGAKSDQPAKVRSLVGDKDVYVEDKTVALGKLQKYQRLTGIAIAMNTVPRDDDGRPAAPPAGTGKNDDGSKSNDANEVTLSGPGSVRLLQRGGSDFNTAPARPPPNQPAPNHPAPNRPAPNGQAPGEQKMKLTYVRFDYLMKASSRTNTANFWGSVRVLNFPCEDPHYQFDLDTVLATELPPEAMYLRSNQLKVHSYQKQEWNAQKQEKQERSYQEMEADGQVVVRAKEFFAQADHMTFNEEKDQVIFIGKGDRRAVLEKRYVKGQQAEVFRARKIIYIRSTGQVTVDRSDSIYGN
ncbi:MAG TPA: hypothetical protein VH682_03690 [Gemmataceae bacterium]